MRLMGGSEKSWPAEIVGSLVLAALAGCYDPEEMVQRAQDDAVQTQFLEIDLGEYLVTLPRDKQTGALMELSLHYFGNVPRYRAAQMD